MSSLEELKDKAFKNPEVKAEYDKLQKLGWPVGTRAKQMVVTRIIPSERTTTIISMSSTNERNQS